MRSDRGPGAGPAGSPIFPAPTQAKTHNLLLVLVAAAVGGGQCGRAGLTVPGHVAELRGAADGQRVDAVGVAIAVTAVMLPAPVPRGPDEDGAQPPTALWTENRVRKARWVGAAGDGEGWRGFLGEPSNPPWFP